MFIYGFATCISLRDQVNHLAIVPSGKKKKLSLFNLGRKDTEFMHSLP